MPATYEKIATTTVNSGTSVTLSSIPATYTDLVLVVAGNNTAPTDLRVRFNGDTGSNYYVMVMFADGGSTRSSFAEINQTSFYGSFDVNSNAVYNILDYTATNKTKSNLVRTNLPGYYTMAYCQLWNSTSAINSIQCYVTSGAYTTNVVFTLYGILKA
jgi:hypothetical protein